MKRCVNNIFIFLFEEHRNWKQTHKYQAHSPHPGSEIFSLSHTLTDLDALAEVNGERDTPQERASRLGFSGLICAYLEPVNNAWDVSARGSAGIKWLSARYPSIPGPSRSAPQVSFSPSSGGNFHALLGKHFPGHIFNYSESRADSHPSGSLSHALTHARPTPTLNKLCLKRKWVAPEDRSCDTSDKQQVCSECLPAFLQCQSRRDK